MSVKAQFIDFFAGKFHKVPAIMITQRSSSFRSLSASQAAGIDGPVIEQEVRNVVCACGSDKSLGPDGFMFAFYKP